MSPPLVLESCSRSKCLSTLLILFAELLPFVQFVNGVQFCQDSSDCVMLVGYTCQNSECVCEPERDMGLFSCAQIRSYGDKCRSDQDCHPGDTNLICARSESRTCRCRRGLVWDIVSKRCYLIDQENPFMGSKFDPVRDVIIPAVILTTLGATGWLCFKLFCNCGKTWNRRRRNADMGRSLEEAQVASQPTAWVASYRVISSLESRPGGGSSGGGGPFPPAAAAAAACLLLPVGPPPYEEALKHKVILSSYHHQQQPLCHHQHGSAPPPPAVMGMTSPAAAPVHHQYQAHL
ncbi:hypothetical protein AAG570_004678 [Ranatra chinensis]|uniref:EB domain-containing protein n=1 Tax=Ranatra chinensis TaxID=642074 RepID=A0ABD0Y1J4_9HEMI